MVNRILNVQTKSVALSAGILGIASLLNSILGLFRDRLLAAHFGAGKELDVYFAAFRVPDFTYNVLIAGGIASVFLPVFAEHFSKNPKEGWRLTNIVLNFFLLTILFICGIILLFTPALMRFVTPGFTKAEQELVVLLTRVMLLSPIFFVLSSIFYSILHYFHRFVAYALAPLIYNLGIITGVLFLFPRFGLVGLAYGVVLGAFFYFFILFVSAFWAGFQYAPIWNLKDRGLRKIFLLSIPRNIGAIVNQVNLFFVTSIASTLAQGSLAIVSFSNNLQSFPISLIGASLATAAFPMLAKAWTQGDLKSFSARFSIFFRQLVFLITPVVLLLFLLRAQIVRIILGTGEFGWRDTRLTAASLGIFAFGTLALALTPLVLRSFYALQDTKTPLIAAAISMGLNVVFAFLFVSLLGSGNFFQNMMVSGLTLQGISGIQVIGLAFALVLSNSLELLILLVVLYRRVKDLKIKEIWRSARQVIFASFCLVVAAFLIRQLLAQVVDMRTFWGIFAQAVGAAGAGIAAYIAVAFLLRSEELFMLYSSLIANLKKGVAFLRS